MKMVNTGAGAATNCSFSDSSDSSDENEKGGISLNEQKRIKR